jgi:hypothetical protein
LYSDSFAGASGDEFDAAFAASGAVVGDAGGDDPPGAGDVAIGSELAAGGLFVDVIEPPDDLFTQLILTSDKSSH